MTGLAVFLDDALTVHQSEAVSLLHLMVEDMRQHIGIHAMTRISHRHLYIVILLGSRDIHMTTFGRELTGIVCQRVQHEERQHTVSLDSGLGG